jgi:hypothetical protein
VFRCGSPDHSRVWRGFPIRTPWDHSPVIDSPRLIADSYVLLRLLMPRHPPCALKNLTTKDQGVIHERTMKTTPQPATPHKGTTTPRHRSRFIFLEIASYKRCSRPLCSSQTTTPYHTPHTHPQTGKPCDRCSQETRNKQPGKNKALPGPVASGPNSVPNTKPHEPRPAPFQDDNPPKREPVRTRHRTKPRGRYLLIFHP